MGSSPQFSILQVAGFVGTVNERASCWVPSKRSFPAGSRHLERMNLKMIGSRIAAGCMAKWTAVSDRDTSVKGTAPADPLAKSKGISHAWRAMRHRNFRLYYGGQTI